MFQTINPSNEEKIQQYPLLRDIDVQSIIEQAYGVFRATWSQKPLAERLMSLQKIKILLLQEKQECAQLMTQEMGKPISQSMSEIEKCIALCEYYIKHTASFLTETRVESPMQKSFISFQPQGVILAIMPWNFPFWQVFRMVIPTLMSGNVVVVKHAPSTMGCAEKIHQLFAESFPQGVYSNLIIDVKQVEAIIAHPFVRAVSLTGSTQAGRSVAALAGKYLKKCVLELGGSDPYLILEDADLESAAEKCVQSRLINSGQSCIAAKRWLVTRKNYSEFRELVLEKMKHKICDDPMDMSTDVGPLARQDLRKTVHEQVEACVQSGGKLLLGGRLPERRGFYYPVTLLDQPSLDSPAFRDEIFGPVGSVFCAQDEKELLAWANWSRYGLGAAIFSRDEERAEEWARSKLDVGVCFINDMVRSDPRMPFGGVKDSGYGRELSVFGIHEFVNIKSVCRP